MQGQCKPKAESSLFAEVQPVLAISDCKGTAISCPIQQKG